MLQQKTKVDGCDQQKDEERKEMKSAGLQMSFSTKSFTVFYDNNNTIIINI